MASSTIQEVYSSGLEAFNAHDGEGLAATWADDVSTQAPGAEELTGKEAVGAYFRSWLEAFPDAHLENRLHVAGDVVVDEGVFAGTHRGVLRTPAGDLPATGRRVRVDYVEIARFRGDRIASMRLVFDRVEMLEQLGLAPSPEAGHEARPAGTSPEALQTH